MVRSQLEACLVALEAAENAEADEREMAKVRALALSDPEGFSRAVHELPGPYDRASLMEAVVLDGTVDPGLESVVLRFVEQEVTTLSALVRSALPDLDEALAPLSFLTGVEWPAIHDGLADALYDRVLPCARHADANVRVLAAELLVSWGRSTRRGSRDPVRELLERDPDPLVRATAYENLARVSALPEGAKMPWSPRVLRGVRRWWNGVVGGAG